MAALLVWLSAAGMAQASTLTALEATGVDVNGAFFDVTFSNGSCISLFDGCDDPSDFTFTTVEAANAASQALLSLFNAPGNEAFTSDPSSIVGCENATIVCQTLIPFSGNGTDFFVAGFSNSATAGFDETSPLALIGTAGNDSIDFNANFALFSVAVTPVPVPASLPLLSAALIGLAALGRRKRKTA